MPVATVAGEPRSIEAQHGANLSGAEPCHQPLETGPRHHPARGPAQTLFPPRRRHARGRLDQVVRAHRQKRRLKPVEAPLLADEYGFDRRGHIVVNATPAHSAEQAEGVVVLLPQHFQPALPAAGVNLLKRLAIDPGRSRISAAAGEGFGQNVFAVDLVPQGVEAEAWFSLSFPLQRGLQFSTVSDGVCRLIVNRRAVRPSLAWVGSGLLPSAGITRPQRYYEPIRHLRPPALALTGSPLREGAASPPRSQTSLVAHRSCPVRAAITTPVGSSAACLARFIGDGGLPRSSGGSAPTLRLSRPAQCSLALRPARSADPLRGLFSKCFRPFVAS